jgi:hypothetical protein
MFFSLSHIYFLDSPCTTLVYIDLVRPFKSALVALELFSSNLFPSLYVGGVIDSLYPSTTDHQASNHSACMRVFIILLQKA